MAFNESLHPRVPGGQAGGGEFGSSGKSTSKPPAKKTAAATMKKGVPPFKGSLSFDAKSGRGAGYGSKGGDANVRTLQHKLNRLGLTDSNGNPLVLDGKLGPKTTAAIKAAQKKLGLKPDGVVTAALFQKILAMKGAATPPKPSRVRPKPAPKSHRPAPKQPPHRVTAPKTAVKPKKPVTAQQKMRANPLVRTAY